MIFLENGRFMLAEDLSYSKKHHIFLDLKKKKIGLDQIGYLFLKSPTNLTMLVEDYVKLGEPFASISNDNGISTLIAPCSGKIKSINKNALDYMKVDIYKKGYILTLENISEIDPELISGENIENWGKNEIRSLFINHYSFKIIEIGDSAVGKTAIKVRFTDNYFKQDLKTTLGVDFGSKEINCEMEPNDKSYSVVRKFKATLMIWDAAGQAHYERIRSLYYRDAKGAILCYDVSNPISFKNLKRWVSELEENLGKKVPVLLVGNKVDLENRVSIDQAIAYAKKNNFLFVECSAKTGQGINEAFKQLAIEIYKKEENYNENNKE